MNLPLSKRLTGRVFLLLLSHLFVSSSQSQTYTQVTYAGSGLTNTVATNSNADVLAGNPVIGGLTHSTLSSSGPVTVTAPQQTMNVNPPGFDGTSLYIGAQYAFVTVPGPENENDFMIDAYGMNYTFSPGYTYFVTLHSSSTNLSNPPGIGMSIGTPSLTENFSLTGNAMASYNNVPLGVANRCVNNFIASPMYSAWLPGMSGFTDISIPSFTVSASTTGLNLEALPAGGSGASYLEIASVTIVGIAPISPASGAVCSSTTFSVPDAPGWPVSWSISPAGIASLSPSGSSVTATKVSNGNATLTATLTAPDGRNYSVSTPIYAGNLPTPGAISPAAENLPPNNVAEFNSQGANWWVVSNGTIFAGQGGDDIGVRVANVSSGFLTVTAYAQNGCGLGTGVTNQYPIVPGSPPGDSYRAPAVANSAAVFNTDSLVVNANLFPNPATNSVRVYLPALDLTKAYIGLYDLSGHLLRLVLPTSQLTQVDISHWAKGTYIVAVFDGQHLKTSKLIKQ